ncbi:MAG TPA: hypothetical protein VHP33_00360 [Polyangiaceae bacterium]|nr:hypothetical protein [Polyangiaceae bacterium]
MLLRSSGFAGACVLVVFSALTAGVACSGSEAGRAASAAGNGGGAVGGAGNVAGSGAGSGSVEAGANAGGSGAGMSSGGFGGSAGSATGGAGGGSIGSGGEAGAPGGGAAARDFSTNRDAFFGASRCATAGVQLCEDFESGTLDTATWKTGGTAPTIDELQAARGKKALHVKQGQGNSQIRTGKPFPAMNGRYWGRAFVYLNAMPHYSNEADSLSYSHWTVIAATGAKVAGEVRIGGQLQKRYQNATPLNFWGVGTDNRNEPEGSGDWTNADDDPKGAAKPVAEKQWSCVEWMGDHMTDETKFFLDGVEHPSLSTTLTTKHGGNPDKPFYLPEFNAIWFGWAEYQPTTQQFELWFDEIAIDSERIGCVL